MGYAGKLAEKKLALDLRSRGYSYHEILKRVKVSRSTLSLWCRGMALEDAFVERLRERRVKGGELGRLIAARNKVIAREERTSKLIKEGIKQVGSVSLRDKFVAGIALYAGDGVKGDKSVHFANSNPALIKFIADWLREFGRIKESKFRCSVWIHDDQDSAKAVKYWSEITGIPKFQFHKTYIVRSRVESKKVRKKVNEFGVCAIKVADVALQRRIKGWMEALLGMRML